MPPFVPGASAQTTAPAAPPSRREIPPGEPASSRLSAITAASNPLLEAARPLLRTLADMPDSMDIEYALALNDLLVEEVGTFERLCAQGNIRRDHMIGARYCLCTALDEAAMRSLGDGKDASAWASRMLATTFHEDTSGGVKVYLLTGRLMKEPDEHIDLLEVIYRILSFGFEGQYRSGQDAHRRHEAIRQRLYSEIMARRPPVPVPLSPNALSNVQLAGRISHFDFPVWITVVVLSVILLGMYGYDRYRLATRTAEVQKQIADIGRMMPLAAPPAPPPGLHLKELLGNEVAAGTVSVDEDAHHSAVTFRGDAMFPPGGASVNASMGPLVAKIAGEIAKVPGKVSVLGYTDTVPIRGGQFASNEALSEERATQVMQMLQAAGVSASRLEAVGKGDGDPVADNSTVPGRAQNRRVEITVAR
ncbi:type VI secretion system protein TssL, long form [Paraburkholderia sediminicola]|nr:type VI secretion system protein TssL, long form [Paraburkholderia sediminicola]